MTKIFEPDRVYIDVLKVASNENDTLASYYRRCENIIEVADKYYIAIDRFNVPADNIPTIIFNNTPSYYTFTIEYNGTFASAPVLFIPSLQYPTTDPHYYYIYGFDIFIKMINTAIYQAFFNLSLSGVLPVGSLAPYFQIDHTTKILQYVSQSLYYDEFAVPPIIPIKLYCNRNLFNFFRGMPDFIDINNVNRYCRFRVYNTQNNTVGNNLIMSSNKSQHTIVNWNVCKGIIFVSNSLCVQGEGLPNVNTNNGSLISSDLIVGFINLILIRNLLPNEMLS
jgi:hypothetical protein